MDNRTIDEIRENETKLINELEEKERRIKDVIEYIRKTDTLFDFIEDKNIGIDNCVCVSDNIHRAKIIGMLIGE